MKKKKTIKIIIIILIAIFVATIMFVFVLPKIYLARKYDTKMNDYRVERFTPGYFMYDVDYWKIKWHETELIYERKDNNRLFKVDFFNFSFYDSYQREDVEEWITEELKENIDKNIDYVYIGHNTVYGIYDDKNDKYTNVVWKRDNIDNILNNSINLDIYILCEDFEKYLINPNNLQTYNLNNINKYGYNYLANIKNKLETNYNSDLPNIYLHKYKLTLEKDKYNYFPKMVFGVENSISNKNKELYVIKG